MSKKATFRLDGCTVKTVYGSLQEPFTKFIMTTVPQCTLC